MKMFSEGGEESYILHLFVEGILQQLNIYKYCFLGFVAFKLAND